MVPVTRVIAMLRGDAGAISFFVALVFAFGLGVWRALAPGHGKALTVAYLLGRRSRFGQGLVLGLLAAITQTVTVIGVGLIAAHWFDQTFTSDARRWFQIASGLLILLMASQLVRARDHEHRHMLGDAQEYGDATEGARETRNASEVSTFRRLAAIGFVAGLVPGPEAVVIAFVAFSVHRWAVGVALVLAWSAALALVLIVVAALAVRSLGPIERISKGRVVRWGPRLAAGIFLLVGITVIVVGLQAM